jgi:hypothetical protein
MLESRNSEQDFKAYAEQTRGREAQQRVLQHARRLMPCSTPSAWRTTKREAKKKTHVDIHRVSGACGSHSERARSPLAILAQFLQNICSEHKWLVACTCLIPYITSCVHAIVRVGLRPGPLSKVSDPGGRSQRGAMHHFTCPHAPWATGIVERLNKRYSQWPVCSCLSSSCPLKTGRWLRERSGTRARLAPSQPLWLRKVTIL